MATTKKRPKRMPRLNPKNGSPVYYPTEPGTIPDDKIEAAVHKVLAAHGMLHPKALAKMRKPQP